ncbi:hypothetical protein HYH02_001111 [Chlamydomonas schloesseri]|uniref:Uncharacterized protein n=1 Tax=Chlamydomonas schloesseri TaxID=2026947 RepID=A0A836BC46_9CHLO|nr:hypothetical protein HYH02_001111 [Chlamydomonas schloesseri]|eukprot:KAG2454071.1 hypothetical protein HYH02_001111 [Chlamydomonas schloesseri]
MDVDESDFSLDAARETLFTLQRACERFTAALSKTVDSLNSKKEDDEWLLEVLDEAAKGVAFHEQQLSRFQQFHGRVHEYVEELRQEANQLAIAELQGWQEGVDAAEAGGGAEGPSTSATGGAAAAEQGSANEVAGGVGGGGGGAPLSTPLAGASRRKSTKTVHPELLKFKLEKQAKILGRYGGVPALGAGLILPRLMKDSILKATGSPAAREIHYSKVENKDAANLAEVMRFKVRKSEEGGGPGGPVPSSLSPWQAELSTKKGKTALDGTDAKDQVTPSTRSHAVYGEELGDALQQRQAALEQALAAERRAAATPAAARGPIISADAMGELADKLRRRQSAAQEADAAAAAAAAEAAEAEAEPVAPAWSNTTAPFGGELAAALQRRAEQQRQPAATPGAAGSGERRTSGDETGDAAGRLPPRPPLASAPGPATPGTPVMGLITPAAARRSAPPSSLTPGPALPLPGMGAGNNELAEKLLRRRSAVEASNSNGSSVRSEAGAGAGPGAGAGAAAAPSAQHQ